MLETAGLAASSCCLYLAGTAAVTAGAAGVVARRPQRGGSRRGLTWPVAAAGVGLLGAYAATLGRAELAAARDPSPARLQRAVGTGVLGLMPLEAAMLPTWATTA